MISEFWSLLSSNLCNTVCEYRCTGIILFLSQKYIYKFGRHTRQSQPYQIHIYVFDLFQNLWWKCLAICYIYFFNSGKEKSPTFFFVFFLYHPVSQKFFPILFSLYRNSRIIRVLHIFFKTTYFSVFLEYRYIFTKSTKMKVFLKNEQVHVSI